MAEQDLNGYLSQFSPVDYTAPEGMKKPGDAGIVGNILDALSVALNPENPSAPYNMAMQRQAQLKQDKVGYLSGIATDFLSKNPGADPAVVASILKKTAPDVYDQVDKSEVFNAIQKSIEPIVKFNEDDFKNTEYAAAKDFNAFNTDRPVYAVVGGTAQLNPMYEKVGKSYWKSWLENEKKYKVTPMANGVLKVTDGKGFNLSKEALDEISAEARAKGVNFNNIVKAFSFDSGLNPGELTEDEKYKNEKELAWARNAGKPKTFDESMKYITDTFAVNLPEGSFDGISNTYLTAAAKAHFDAVRSATPENIAKFDNAISNLLVKKDVPESVKIAMKNEVEKMRADSKDASKADSDYRKSKLDTLKDLLKRKKITQADYDAEIKIMRAQEGKKSDDKPGKWEEQ